MRAKCRFAVWGATVSFVSFLFAILIFANFCFAATIHVPGDQPTIQAGIDVAVNLDTVLVEPGTYTENIDFSNKTIKVISVGGSNVTSLVPALTSTTTITFQGGEGTESLFNGFTVYDGGQIANVSTGASPTIANNVFHDNASDPLIPCYGPAKFERNLFYNNTGISCIGIHGVDAIIINNTFDSNSRGFYSVSGGAGIAKNNIVINSTEYGVFGKFAEFDYNDVWNNGTDYLGGADAGENDISADPLFVNSSAAHYELSNISPCIDAGDPDPQYDDPDGSRNDIGALPVGSVPLVGEN